MSLNTFNESFGIKVTIIVRTKFTYKTNEGVIYYNKRQAIGFILPDLAKGIIVFDQISKIRTQFVFNIIKTKANVLMIAHNLKVLYSERAPKFSRNSEKFGKLQGERP